MQPGLTCEDFQPGLNQIFRIHYASHAVDLKLVECSRLNTHGRKAGQREPFSLLFLGPMRPVLPQQMHNFDFGALGVLDIFIVPIGPNKEKQGMQYEAVFA